MPKKFLCLILIFLISGFPLYSETNKKKFYASGPSDKKIVTLTFDDGPCPETGKLLDLLDEKNVKVTFFMLGEQVKIRPKTAKEVFLAGHEIANHTNRHINFYSYKGDDIQSQYLKELLDGEKEIYKAVGNEAFKIKLVRSPYGFSKPWAQDIADKQGYAMINWTYGSDWEKTEKEQMAKNYIAHIQNGAIFLLHDNKKDLTKTLYVTEILIDALQEKGYSIVTVSELLSLK